MKLYEASYACMSHLLVYEGCMRLIRELCRSASPNHLEARAGYPSNLAGAKEGGFVCISTVLCQT
jgi:hypothetical protein